MATSPVDISPYHLKIVCGILQKHLPPNVSVWVFGSRADWTTKNSSDLDLALEGKSELEYDITGALEYAFEESDLPYKVDVIDLNRVADSFRHIVEVQRVPLPDWHASNNDTVRLRDVAELIMGHSPPGLTRNKTGLGMAFFQGVKDFNHRSPSPNTFCSAPSRIAQPGDILFSVRAPIGRVNIADRRCAVGRGLAIIRCSDPVDAHYMEFLLKYMKPWDAMGASGAVFGNATKKDLENLVIRWPNMQERQIVSHALRTLDDKIELNRRMNLTLEEMARTLFKSWFVDFDPVRAKTDGRWGRGRPLPGLPAHLYDLLPDGLADSELGAIPSGWAVKALENCFNLKMGRHPSSGTRNDRSEGLPFLQGGTDFGSRYPTNRKYCSAPVQVARAGDTLISVRAPAGVVNMAWEKCCIGRGIAALRHKTNSRSFTYYFTQSVQHDLKQREQAGTSSGAITKRHLEALPVVEPPAGLVGYFETCVSALDDRIRSNMLESRLLSLKRNALLPKLMSGNMRIPLQAGGGRR